MNVEPDNKKEQVNSSLYSKHLKVYPQRITGTFRQFKWMVLGTLLGFYYVVPWIRWDRGTGVPDQAVLLD
ncbi:MAG: cytochrome c oxidase accessory protein CcoG, partial [Rhodospirillaceae bacterium]|nr:cytochrome c oxidase accessory protein CcoG [Rhodospirillaceae bacterium]